MPICTKCGKKKRATQFFRRRNSAGELVRRKNCKRCSLDYQAVHYRNSAKRRADIKRANAGYIAKLRAQLLEYLSDKACVDCGERDPVVLEFDHRSRRTKVLTISKMIAGAWSWRRVLREIKKCDIRCANCHRRRTAKQCGWWTSKIAPVV